MPSDFAHARELLELAWLKLPDDDETSVKTRQALDLLVEALARAEHTKPPAQIIRFRPADQSAGKGSGRARKDRVS